MAPTHQRNSISVCCYKQSGVRAGFGDLADAVFAATGWFTRFWQCHTDSREVTLISLSIRMTYSFHY